MRLSERRIKLSEEGYCLTGRNFTTNFIEESRNLIFNFLHKKTTKNCANHKRSFKKKGTVSILGPKKFFFETRDAVPLRRKTTYLALAESCPATRSCPSRAGPTGSPADTSVWYAALADQSRLAPRRGRRPRPAAPTSQSPSGRGCCSR
jgi:hypothetical protein